MAVNVFETQADEDAFDARKTLCDLPGARLAFEALLFVYLARVGTPFPSLSHARAPLCSPKAAGVVFSAFETQEWNASERAYHAGPG